MTESPTKSPTQVLALFQILLFVWVGEAAATEFNGAYTAKDGDSFFVGSTEVRLCGVDAPPLSRPGGKTARDGLTAFISGRAVVCKPAGSGTPCDGLSKLRSRKRVVSQCFVGGVDLAAELVRLGHARDWTRFSGGVYASIMPDHDLPTEIAAGIVAMTPQNAAETVTLLRRYGIRLLMAVADIEIKMQLDADYTAALDVLATAVVAGIEEQDIERYRDEALIVAGRMAAMVRLSVN